VLNDHVQQWSAIQTMRAAHLVLEDVFLTYAGLAGDADPLEVEAYLSGLLMLPAAQRDLVAQAINELLDYTGSTVDGAHYSDRDSASSSGYGDYLRALILNPDGYDFAAPPAGDHSAGPTTGEGGQDEDDDEFRRCDALRETGLLDTGAEERFDRITREARDHLGVSSASISLITADSQVIKSVIGPLGQDLPRDLSLCARTIEQDRTLVIEDAGKHPQWHDHPLVAGGPKVRFYAGHPISTAGGWRIGSLCVMDDQPRTFTDEDALVLRRLAARAQLQIWA
jgi:hypothetical protein